MVIAGLALLASLLLACASPGRPASAPTSAILICPEGQQTSTPGACSPAAAAAPGTSRPPPADRKPPAEDALGALRGQWRGEDSEGGAVYELSIGAGTFAQDITRPTPHQGATTCHQQGTVRFEAGLLTWSYEINTCNTDYEGQESSDELADFDGHSFQLRPGGYAIHYTRQR